jgi:large conductance mechanosensitive channel
VRKYFDEFKDFINKGDVVTIAVGLIMALYFAKIIDAVLNGVLNPIIAAIFGKPDYREIGFDIGEARISIGLVIDAAISFLVVAFLLFLVIKAYNRYKGPTEPGGPTDVELLAEIRDELRAQRAGSSLPPPTP